jgi:hypothetical protein
MKLVNACIFGDISNIINLINIGSEKDKKKAFEISCINGDIEIIKLLLKYNVSADNDFLCVIRECL